VTWITDGPGTRWVPHEPRKRRKPGRALRFADLKPGDVLIHRAKWKHEVHVPPTLETHTLANDNRRVETGVAVGFALCEARWFDPVAGESDPIAGEMVAVRALTDRGAAPSLWRHTLRGLASNGYHPTTPEQGEAVRRWMADRDRLMARVNAAEITVEEARAAYRPYRMLLRDVGLDDPS
jgi:hypothetical protein